MIYDPARRALETQAQRILESMSAEEIEAYHQQTKRPDEKASADSDPLPERDSKKSGPATGKSD